MRGRNHIKRKGGDALRLLSTLVVGAGLTACNFDNALEVELPGEVLERDLENPALAQLLVNSSISSFECAWSMFSAGSAVHGDEYMNSSGNAWYRGFAWRQINSNDDRLSTGDCETAFSIYAPLHAARFQANDAYSRLSAEQFAEVPDLQGKLATLRALAGYSLTALGEVFCEMSVPEEEGVPGPLLTPRETIQRAEARFTEALTLAEASGNTQIRNLALVGRARARLDLEDWAGVIEDASQVPAGFLYVITRGDQEARRYNQNYNVTNSEIQSVHATITPDYRNLRIDAQGRPIEGPVSVEGVPQEGEGVPDPRVQVENRGVIAFNSVTPVWHNLKYTSRSSPMPVASYKEARLFLAEAYAQTGQLEQARAIINARRTELGLPTFDLAATQEEMIDLILEERRRELFIEGGHRLNDMLRYRGTSHEIPFLGDPGSYHPDGVDSIGGEYSDATCFPLPDVERLGNPNIPDTPGS